MSSKSTAPPPSPADRLVSACWQGDVQAAAAAVADGASVNGKAAIPFLGPGLPLVAALYNAHDDAVVWLLSLGADADGDDVMFTAAADSASDILQLLIDVGGDVNRASGRAPPLFCAVLRTRRIGNVAVLLAQPCLDLAAVYDNMSPLQFAHSWHQDSAADLLVEEVSAEVGAGRWLIEYRIGVPIPST